MFTFVKNLLWGSINSGNKGMLLWQYPRVGFRDHKLGSNRDKVAKEAAEAGLNCVEYKDGRRVNITTYIEMALRTSSMRARLSAEGAKRDE